MKKIIITLFVIIFLSLTASAEDWPIFKGNLYFTGNNDEIVVPNNNLKWLFQADERIFNPIVSDGKIYFIDIKGNIYCVNEYNGKLIWKNNISSVSAQFKKISKTAGKIKYPLIKDNILLLSDSVAIYAFNKNNGNVLWARTAFQVNNTSIAGKPVSSVMINGIYSDPIILNDDMYYGTREQFIARNILSGNEKWQNNDIKSYSGFPTFYDDRIFTQSMNYQTNEYIVYCINSADGSVLWSKKLEKPMIIYPPVVYNGSVYIPVNNTVYSLDINNGSSKWSKDYGKIITSSLGFSDRAIIFTADNSEIIIIDPKNGNVLYNEKISEKSSPNFVIIRDHIYIAYNAEGPLGKTYGNVKAVSIEDNKILWTYQTPFPGAVSQSLSSKGILYFPAGNYLYAIGATAYSKVVDGGSGYLNNGGDSVPDVTSQTEKVPAKPEVPAKVDNIKTRKIKIDLFDSGKTPINGYVDIVKINKDGTVFSNKIKVNKSSEIEVPDDDGVEITASADNHVSKIDIINKKDNEKTFNLDKIEKGKSIIINNINFEFNKAYLKKESLPVLNDVIMYLKKNASVKLEVRGYTDNVGDDKYNQKLSEKRADSVIEYMIKNGISPERLKSVGFGKQNPVADNNTEEGRTKNRRTEFLFVE